MEKKRRTGKYCVVFGCNSTHVDDVSLHEFPKENRAEIRRQWINFVKVKRKDFQNPTKFTVVCEKHFADGSYPQEYELKKLMNVEVKRKILLPHAVPTIQSQVDENESDSSFRHLFPSMASTPIMTPPKKMRSAYRKRECTRVLLEHDQNSFENDLLVEMETTISNEPENIDLQTSKNTVGTQFGQQKASKRSKRVQVKPLVVDKVVQADIRIKPKTRNIGIQCNMRLEKKNKPMDEQQDLNVDEDLAILESGPLSPASEQPQPKSDDSDYNPESDEDISDADSEYSETATPATERKFIVFESQLLLLFSKCPCCSIPTLANIKHIMGTMIKVEQDCGGCGFHREWDSQPMIGAVPTGNLLLSSAILFSGSLPSKAIRLLEHMNVASICTDTFTNHQNKFLFPAIDKVWKTFQEKYFDQMRSKGLPLVLGGDGRADTPGHSAKYGSYSTLDLDHMLIIDIQLVQSNEVGNSARMEKEGLRRFVEKLHRENLQIGELVTDRHTQIVKWVRENLPNTVHCFDVWHVAKGLKKKLCKLAKEKNCADLLKWIKSICNHLYWVAASTPDGNGDLMLQKWLSVANHVINIHRHDMEQFSKCQHGRLTGRERRKKWLKPGTKVSEKLSDIIHSKQLKRDVPKLSSGPQTASLEGFHSTINHFAPKMIGFSYHGMLARLTLAALHFNENGMREQAVTKQTGEKRYSVLFPKYKKGGYTVREIKTDCTYGYVNNLLSCVKKLAAKSDVAQPLPPAPPPLCSAYVHPDKSVAVQQITSRFNEPVRNQCNFQQDLGK